MFDRRLPNCGMFGRLALAAMLWFSTSVAVAADISIVQPKLEETVHNNSGNVTVEIKARLDRDQQVRLLMDGSKAAPDSRDPTFNLQGIDRGEHTLQALVIDAKGEVVSRSDEVVFYMWQASRQFPSRKH